MKYYEAFRSKETVYMQYNVNLSLLVTSYVGTAFWNVLLKERERGRDYEEEDVNRYWMKVRERKDSGL